MTDKGIHDAQLLGIHLKDMNWTAIYSSPSKRTVRTAEIIKGDNPMHIQKDERLLEMHLGHLEGLTMEEIKEHNSALFSNYWNKPTQFANDTGESFFQVKDRVTNFIEAIQLSHQSGNILIVTHGVVIKMVQVISSKLPLNELWQTPFIDGTSVTKLRVVGGEMETKLAGNLSHLKLKVD